MKTSDRINHILLSNVEVESLDSTILKVTLYSCLQNTTSDTLFYVKRMLQDIDSSGQIVQFDHASYMLEKRNVWVIPTMFSHAQEYDSIIAIPPGKAQFFISTLKNITSKYKKRFTSFEFRDDFIPAGNYKLAQEIVNNAKYGLSSSSNAAHFTISFSVDLKLNTVTGISNKVFKSYRPGISE